MSKYTPLPDDELFEEVLGSVAKYAREHPSLSLAELADMLPGDGQGMVMTLQVKDLWPWPGYAPDDTDTDKTASVQVARVAKLQTWISEGDRKTFTANEVMEALECSRNTALRTIRTIPNIRTEGKASSAKYVVS